MDSALKTVCVPILSGNLNYSQIEELSRKSETIQPNQTLQARILKKNENFKTPFDELQKPPSPENVFFY